MELIRHQVHRLPTEDKPVKGEFILIKRNPLLGDTFDCGECIFPEQKSDRQHLYFTNDEKIKKGDKVLRLSNGEIFDAQLDRTERSNDFKKITASTDLKLTNCNICGINLTETGGKHKMSCKDAYKRTNLPQVSQYFIKAYCKQGGIDYVDVEYQGDWWSDETRTEVPVNGKTGPIPKLTPDNTIITHLIEEKMIPLNKVEDCVVDVVYKMMFRSNEFPQEQKDKAKEFCNGLKKTYRYGERR
jgi:hypothetical protein